MPYVSGHGARPHLEEGVVGMPLLSFNELDPSGTAETAMRRCWCLWEHLEYIANKQKTSTVHQTNCLLR